MSEASPHLDFDRLDEISVARFAGLESVTGSFVTEELGPFLEWQWLEAAGYTLGDLTHSQRTLRLSNAIKSGTHFWIDSEPPGCGFIRVRRAHTATDDVPWTRFCRSLEDSGVKAGLSRTRAKQLTGATGELEDNVHAHSEAAHTGMVAFCAHRSKFEIVVLDRGIGVLASLKQADEYSSLADYGEAIELAVAPGNSRFGSHSGRGMGFHDLFLGIANAQSRVRFRSGDHLLDLDGRGLTSPDAKLVQRALGGGFMIAIQCTETSPSS